MMIYSYTFEERVQSLIFPSPISLDSFNFAIGLSLNKVLEIMKTLEYF
jgi:hypothetical protein